MVDEIQAGIEAHLEAFARTGRPAELDALLEASQPWVRRVAATTQNAVPWVLTVDDLCQVALLALVACARNYAENPSPERLATWRGWTFQRMRGAALDLIRQMSSNSRTRNVEIVPLLERDIDVEDIDLGRTPFALDSAFPTHQDAGHGHVVDLEWSEQFDEVIPSNLTIAVRDSLNGLTLRQATVLLLLFNGMTLARLAILLNLSPTSIANERDAALAHIRGPLTAAIRL